MQAIGWFGDAIERFGEAGWWGPHMLGGALFWLVVVVAAALLVRQLAQRGPGPDWDEGAPDIFEKRHANRELKQGELEPEPRDLQA